MKPQMNTDKHRYKSKKKSVSIRFYLWLIIFSLSLTACAELEKPTSEPYYAETAPPPKQEFRWSNGKMPKSFDPALAAAPPETDIVRAVYEGLTDTDAKNLEPIPSIALKWKSEEDNKIWTFELRRDAKWSNGETVTAEDFVRSWKRLTEIGEGVSHPDLLNNIVGMQIMKKEEISTETQQKKDELDILPKSSAAPNSPIFNNQPTVNLPKVETKLTENTQRPNPDSPLEKNPKFENKEEKKTDKKESKEEKSGVEAIDKFTLKVTLNKPDKDFPALIAHPMFRPIYKETVFEKDKLKADVVTNGAFRISSVGQDGVTLDKAENYWNKDTVKLERVRFVPQESAEKALQAYRAGELDAVTNAEFEPLALKLLTPFDDFKRTVHSALNFYEFNQNRKPFDDKRVREAMAISIDRKRLTDDEMDGASKPALGFLPYSEENEAKISQDSVRAQKLLTEAGFPNGENFPKVKLLINRNNMQERIANSVAKMWKQNLNIETEIVIEESQEIETAKQNGDYDMIRRGVVLPTADETANMMAIFSPEKSLEKSETENQKTPDSLKESKNIEKLNSNITASTAEPEMKMPQLPANIASALASETDSAESKLILTEEDALIQLPAIPLYFPTSYSLVKPYVLGFEINTLDAPSLKDVSIDNYWQPKKPDNES
jgi:oligopeptide transport system substrate-binding protein